MINHCVLTSATNAAQDKLDEPLSHLYQVDQAAVHVQLRDPLSRSAEQIMLGLVLAFLLAGSLPGVGCDGHTKTSVAAMIPDSMTLTPPMSRTIPAPPVKPIVNITAVFEMEDLDDYQPIFDRALADFVNDSVIFTWTGHVLGASRDLKAIMTEMCAHFQGDRSQVRLIVVFGNVRTVQTVNLVSEALGIPVIGYMLDKGDGFIQVRPFCLS